MKVAFVADLHVANHRKFGGAVEAGINRRCRLILDTVAASVAEASTLGCEHYVILGDVFDTVTPEPQVITALRFALSKFNGDVWVLMGNHDQVSEKPGDHSLGPLNGPNIRVVERPMSFSDDADSSWEVALVPYRPGKAAEWLGDAVAKVVTPDGNEVRRILGLHLGLIVGETPHYLKDASDAINTDELVRICQQCDIESVIAGNWHGHWRGKQDGVTLMQAGTLAPTGWDNPGDSGYGSLVEWDSKFGNLTVHEIPGPRFLKARGLDELRTSLADAAAIEAADGTVFISVNLPREDMQAGEELFEVWGVADHEINIDKADSTAAARGAAHAAKSAETLDQALAYFVGSMELSGTTPELVNAKCREYLRL
jgi:hypothetical protein